VYKEYIQSMGFYSKLRIIFNVSLLVLLLSLITLIVLMIVNFNGWLLSGVILVLLLGAAVWFGRAWADDKYIEFEAPAELDRLMNQPY